MGNFSGTVNFANFANTQLSNKLKKIRNTGGQLKRLNTEEERKVQSNIVLSAHDGKK